MKQLLEEIGNFRKSLMYILIEIQRAFTAVKLQQEVMKKKQDISLTMWLLVGKVFNITG